jgi:lipopolysaccharide transport system ATP-binding protein
MPEPVIRFEQVHKAYRLGTLPSLRERLSSWSTLLRRQQAAANDVRTLWALRGVDLCVQPGETVGIIGPNGAGKTTMLKLIAGITKPTSGRVHVRGRVSSLIELGAGFHPDLTGRENIFLNGAILGLRRREIERLFDQIVAFAELERFIDTPVKRYSSGMYARLGFAVAAHVSPDVLLVDEVLSVGDAAFQRRCYEKVWDLVHHEGRSVLMVSHGFGYIRALCNRVVWLQRGEVQQIGEPDAVIRAYESSVFSNARLRAGLNATEEEGQVQIVSVTLLNENGLPAETYAPCDPITVRITYLCTPAVANDLSFAVGVMRDDTLNCYTSYADECGFLLPAGYTGGVVEAHYPALRLMPGSYQMYVTALSRNERRTLYTYRTVGFHVMAAGLDIRHGSFYNAPTWRFVIPEDER